MKNGTRILHPKYGIGKVIGQSVLSTAVIIQFSKLGHTKSNTAKLIKTKNIQIIDAFSRM
jgi:hypothetical protein